MKSVWVGTDWHVWSVEHTPHHPYQSVSNIRQLSDSYANDIQVDDVFIYLGDLCDPAVTDLNELKRLVQNIPGYKILVKGNHDTETDYFYRDIGFDEVCDVCVINQVAFSHFPLKVEPDMINIHGHLHNEKRSDVDDANHINAYREDYYKHPIEISELIQNAYDKWLKDRAVHRVGEITDAKTGKAYDASRILYLTDIFEEDMLKPVDEAFVGNDEVSTTYLMSLSTVDTEEKLLKWIRQNLHVGPMGKVKTDIEMARSRSASDFDIALFVNPRLRKLGHNPRLMVFIGYEPNNPKPGFVHMFNYWVDLDDSVIWFEASWRGNEGIHEFENIDDMKTEILSLYRDRIESNKYTETIFHSVNRSYLKPGRDPQEILKNVFGEDSLVNESFAIGGVPNSIIKVDDQDYGDNGLVSSINWFCDMVQLGSQVIYIKTTNRIRNLWAITEQNSSPLGGRGVDYSYVINLDMVPKNIDKFSLMKFVCLFDILVTTSDQRTIEAGCPNALCAAIAYWYSQPYYDQLFELPEEYMHPSKEVQNWFNMIQCYQRTINDTAVDLLVRDLFWNKEVDPKILISSALKNSMIACDVNNESAMSQYEFLLSLNEATYDLEKYNRLVGGKLESQTNLPMKKLTTFMDDLLDANIKITPETIDKVALKQCKTANDLINYYKGRLSEYIDPRKPGYLGSAYTLALLLNNIKDPEINVWENFVPTGLSDKQFAEYMDMRFAELDDIEKLYQKVILNNIGSYKMSIGNAKSFMDDQTSDDWVKVTTSKDGTKVYDYQQDGFGKVYVNANIYRKNYAIIKPSRLFSRAKEYDYIIITHGLESPSNNPSLWKIEHVSINNTPCYTVQELIDTIGTTDKVLLLICNPNGKKLHNKYQNITYATTDVLMESALFNSKLDIHADIMDRVSIIKSQIKSLKRQKKTITKWLDENPETKFISNKFKFLWIDHSINKLHLPTITELPNMISKRDSIIITIDQYMTMLEAAKVIFRSMDNIYYNTIPESGYYWLYDSIPNLPVLNHRYSNPIVTGMVFSTIENCISDAEEYSQYMDIDPVTHTKNNDPSIDIYEAKRGHALPGNCNYINENKSIGYGEFIKSTTITQKDDLNEILMEPEDAHLFLADDEAGEKSQKPYKIKLSTDDQGVMAEAVYNFDKYRELYNFDEGKYKDSFKGDTKLTSLVEDLLDANIKVSPESIDRVALSNVKSAESLVKYFSERIEDLTESDSFVASGFIFATLLNNTNGSMNLEKFSDFVPTNLNEDEFSKYMEKRFNELKLIDSIYQEILKNNIANYALGVSLSSDDILKAKTIIDSDKTIINTNYAIDTVKYSYGDGFATVFINKNIYNQYGSLTLKPSRLYGRASMYDYIIITHGKSDPSSGKWKVEPITINRRTFIDAKSIVSYLGKNASVLFLICNPDGKLIEGYPKLTYFKTNTLFEKVSLTKSYDMINKTIDHLNKRKRQLKTIYNIFNKWYYKHRPISYPKYVYPQIEFTRYSELTLRKVKFTDVNEFYSVGNSILSTINKYRDMLTKSIYILRLFIKVYYNLIPENGYYWIAERLNKKILIPGISTINPFIVGNVSTLEECYQEILEFYENDDSLIEHWGDIAIYKNHKNSDTICTNECTRTTFNSLINEDAYQLQGIDRDQQDVISKKYGIRAVGHETEEEIKYREEREKAERERKAEFKKKQKDRQLAKARKAKKKIAKKRELEKKKEEFKSKFNKKNEEVDISNIPYNDGSRNFFDSTPGVANADFVNETGYNFEMLDKVKFFDPINESADDRTLYPVYVLCVHTGTLLANVIKKATGSHFSHCTISFDSSLKNMYSFGRKTRLTELSNGSFVKESIHNPPYTNEGVTYALYCIPVNSSQLAAMKKRLEYFVKNKTKFRYDFAGLFKNFFGIADNPEQRWFCSRFVADIINAGTEPGQKPMIREPSLMRPEDFLYTNFALYVTSGLIKDYDQILVDKVTKKLLRIESIRRAQQRVVQSTNIPITESAVLDLNPYDPLGEAIFNYQMATMDESAYQNFKKYLHSFKIKLDKDGNIIIHRREVDQLDKYFREANQLLKVNMKAGNEQGVVDQLCRVHYMINLINKYYLISTTKQNTTVKADLKKQLIDLRSVMINVYQQYLSWVTARNPQFNFQTAYDASIYSDKITVPKEVITSIGRVIMTML